MKLMRILVPIGATLTIKGIPRGISWGSCGDFMGDFMGDDRVQTNNMIYDIFGCIWKWIRFRVSVIGIWEDDNLGKNTDDSIRHFHQNWRSKPRKTKGQTFAMGNFDLNLPSKRSIIFFANKVMFIWNYININNRSPGGIDHQNHWAKNGFQIWQILLVLNQNTRIRRDSDHSSFRIWG